MKPDIDNSRRSEPSTGNVSAVTDAMIAGIGDSDEVVRYFSVCTLMEINGDEHVPAISLFKDNEQDYLNHWKVWANQ